MLLAQPANADAQMQAATAPTSDNDPMGFTLASRRDTIALRRTVQVRRAFRFGCEPSRPRNTAHPHGHRCHGTVVPMGRVTRERTGREQTERACERCYRGTRWTVWPSNAEVCRPAGAVVA